MLLLPPLTPTYPKFLNWPVANITAKLSSSPHLSDPPLSTNISPTLPSFHPPKPYLVLQDTLRSCEAYGMGPTYKEKMLCARKSPQPHMGRQAHSCKVASPHRHASCTCGGTHGCRCHSTRRCPGPRTHGTRSRWSRPHCWSRPRPHPPSCQRRYWRHLWRGQQQPDWGLGAWVALVRATCGMPCLKAKTKEWGRETMEYSVRMKKDWKVQDTVRYNAQPNADSSCSASTHKGPPGAYMEPYKRG